MPLPSLPGSFVFNTYFESKEKDPIYMANPIGLSLRLCVGIGWWYLMNPLVGDSLVYLLCGKSSWCVPAWPGFLVVVEPKEGVVAVG